MEGKYRFILTLGKMLGLNVSTPKEVIDKKEREFLTVEEQNVWLNLQIAIANLPDDSIKRLIRMMVMRYVKTIEVLTFCKDLREDNAEVLTFLRDHKEYTAEMPNPDELFNEL